ncbi:MAG: DUF2155 domain-containing protein [Alphaproteobacteria bacterium]|nr:DUF2155 domain-containing protein [Alphaproteobacteria bacterium]
MSRFLTIVVAAGFVALLGTAVAEPTPGESQATPPVTSTPLPPPSEPPDESISPVESVPLPPVEAPPPPPATPTTPPPPEVLPPAQQLKQPVVVGVILGGLDKIAARTARFEANIGEQVFYNTLIVTARTCKTRPPEEPPESAAYLDIQERKPDGTTANIFSGWMFASSPALSALEHPVYDIWVISCKTVPPDTAAPAPPNS